MKDLCSSTVAALAALIERGQPVSEEQLSHWRSCPRCQSLVETARQQFASLSSTLESDGDPAGAGPSRTAEAATEAGEKGQRQRALQTAALIVIGWALLSLGAGAVIDRPWFGDGSRAAALAGVGIVLALTGAVVIATVTLLRLPARFGFYKRQRRGYWISGVCAGLSEKLSVPVMLLRVGFVVLEVFLGAGIPLYFALSLSLPVHPEDRRHLLAFRVARWWRRMRGGEPAGV
jgi:phage shock protein PspC (stress-responsive transcriptional regulator)